MLLWDEDLSKDEQKPGLTQKALSLWLTPNHIADQFSLD